MSNAFGGYRTTTKNSMAAYDKLPSSARAAMANAAFDWAPQPFVTGFERRGRWKNGKELAAYIVELAAYIVTLDRSAVGKEAYRTYGADHPQAVWPELVKARRKRS